eukprot:g3427.t1
MDANSTTSTRNDSTIKDSADDEYLVIEFDADEDISGLKTGTELEIAGIESGEALLRFQYEDNSKGLYQGCCKDLFGTAMIFDKKKDSITPEGNFHYMGLSPKIILVKSLKSDMGNGRNQKACPHCSRVITIKSNYDRHVNVCMQRTFYVS